MLFPRQCPLCGDVRPFLMEQRPGLEALICPDCLEGLPFISGPVCSKCGKQLSPANISKGLCSDCQTRIRLFQRNYCLLNYDSRMRDLISDIKYRGKREYTEFLSLLAAQRLGDELNKLDIEALIPVPIHEKRLKKRGYNQAELIASGLSERTGIELRADILKRRLSTKAQKELGHDARVLNLQNAFFARIPEGISLRRVLLLDDIYTTGGTLEACTEALLDAGVSEVYGLCIFAGSDT